MTRAREQSSTGQVRVLQADRRPGHLRDINVIGERAVDIVQVAAIAIARGMRVDDLAAVPLSFPTYEGNPI